MLAYLCSFVLPLAAVVAGEFGAEEVAENTPVAVQEWAIADKNFYATMFNGDSGSFSDTVQARKEHDMRLTQKIAIVDRVCGLTNTQKEKLQLAGHGDTKRLFDRVEEVGKQLQLVRDDPPKIGALFTENEPLQRCLRRTGLSNDDRFFVKILKAILTAEQHAKYEPLRLSICDGGEVRSRQVDSKDVLEIDQRRTKFGDEGLSRLSELRNILVLRLDRTRVSDAGLAHLKGLTIIQLLELADVDVTDVGLEQLAGLTSMTMLALDGTKVTDAGLAHLKAMSSLKYLSLQRTKVTDAGFAHLKGLTTLQTLHLGGTQVTAAGIAEMQRALPRVMIESP